MDDELLQQLLILVLQLLELNCPILSGNMLEHIEIEEYGENYAVVSVSGPSYDLEKWQETKQIIHTNEGDYAAVVNQFGAFFSGNKSRHWVNRTLKQACDTIATRYNGEVICYVEL